MAKDNLCAGPFRELVVPTDEVGMQMGLDHVLDFEALSFCFIDVLVDIPLRVDDRGVPFRANEIRRVCKTPQVKLLEVH